MNIAVYAICKNEAPFVSRWVHSMKEADGIYVLDTGSEDGTPELLEQLGVCVSRESITPWRFDTARNRSLEAVPHDTDICVCTDLDEVFRPGWRKALEQAWLPWAQRAVYPYIWSFAADGTPDLCFQQEKIHSRRDFQWTHPVHEILSYIGSGSPVTVYVPSMQLEHHPDPTKSRSQYLPLLELAVAEAPNDDRNRHYLGREYFFYGRWEDCIRTLRSHLQLPSAQWADERAASMLYIARSYANLNKPAAAKQWYLHACGEAPWLREVWIGWAEFSYETQDWDDVLYACGKALSIHNRPLTYLSESRCWGSLPYDLAAVAAWHLGLRDLARAYGESALALEPNNRRLQENLSFYQ